MTYVVKAYAYLDKRGLPTKQIEKAEKFEDEELAKLAADTCGGIYSEVKKVVSIPSKITESKKPASKAKKARETKQNQSWMHTRK